MPVIMDLYSPTITKRSLRLSEASLTLKSPTLLSSRFNTTGRKGCSHGSRTTSSSAPSSLNPSPEHGQCPLSSLHQLHQLRGTSSPGTARRLGTKSWYSSTPVYPQPGITTRLSTTLGPGVKGLTTPDSPFQRSISLGRPGAQSPTKVSLAKARAREEADRICDDAADTYMVGKH